MTITTEETLAFGQGYEVLNTLGYNLEALSAGMARTTRRARATVIPRKPGMGLRRPSQIDASRLDMSMWVTNRDADGVPGGTAQLWANLDLILPLLTSNAQLIPLRKLRQSATGLLTLDASGQLEDGIDYEGIGDVAGSSGLRLLFSLTLPYPYWEGPDLDENGVGTFDVVNPGHAECSKTVVQLTATTDWTNPEVKSNTLGWTLNYTGTITAGDTYTVSLFDGTATDHLGASISGAVDMQGSPFPTLAPGTNEVVVSEDSGTGSARFLFNAPYLG